MTNHVSLCFNRAPATRWLVRGKLLGNILVNWWELKSYFTTAELAIKGQPDVKYQARLLKDMFCDPVTFLYIHFATPVVQDFEKLNYSKFQANNPGPNELMQDLDLFHRCLIGRSLEKNGTPRQEVDLGRTFKQECDRYVSEGVSREEKSQKTACVRAVQERYIV